MVRSRKWRSAVTLALGPLAILAACVGDDPTTSSSTPEGDAATTPPGLTADGSGSLSSDAGGSADGADGSCGDTLTTEANCGACGRACKTGVGCFAGVCGNTVVDLAMGESSTCAVVADGHAYCWGSNANFLVGAPDDTVNHDEAFKILSDQSNNPFDEIVEVTVGRTHACARKQDGTIWCWGKKETQEFVGGSGPRASLMNGLSGYKRVGAGDRFTCGIDGSDVVQCWGINDEHTLGHPRGTDGDTDQLPVGTYSNGAPHAVELPDDAGVLQASSLSVGSYHSCATEKATQHVWCWGRNDEAELGAGDVGEHSYPVKVAPVAASAVFVDSRHSCALVGGTLRCWGSNLYGDIGTGSRQTPLTVPAQFGGLSGVSAAAGNVAVLCANAAPYVYCAGFAVLGSVGNGAFSGDGGEGDEPFAVRVRAPPDGGGESLTDVERLAAGGTHACAKLRDNRVVCWGGNNYGELGNGKAGVNSNIPMVVLGLP